MINYVANRIKARAAGHLAQYSGPTLSERSTAISQQWRHQLWSTGARAPRLFATPWICVSCPTVIMHLILTAPQESPQV